MSKTTLMPALQPLPQDPTKQQEIDYFTQWTLELPSRSYLGSFFKGAAYPVCEAIRDDMSIDSIDVIRKDREYADSERKHAEERRDKVNEELKALERQVMDLRYCAERLRGEMKEAGAALSNLARDSAMILAKCDKVITPR